MREHANGSGHRGLRAQQRLLCALTIVATVALGLPSTSLAASTPSAPQNATAVGGDCQASVSWTAPASAGSSAISSYTVTPLQNGSPTPNAQTMVVDPTITSTTVAALAGTGYSFEVYATNAAGAGPAVISNSVTVFGVACDLAGKGGTGGKAPNAPTNVTASCGNGSSQVSWTAAKAPGGNPVTSYTVTAYAGTTPGPSMTVSGSPPPTTATVSGLTNGVSYTFQVVATNNAGSGPPGVSAPCTPIGVPAAPSNPAAVAANYSATVTWSAPPNNGGTAITGYTITPYAGTSAGSATSVGASATSTTISGLQDGTTYTFQIYATNSQGNGPPATTNAVTPALANIGPYVHMIESGTCCSGGDGEGDGFVSGSQIPAMNQWTVEGYLWDENFTAQFSKADWGLLGGTPGSPGAAVAGIHQEAINGGPWFVWPGMPFGGSNPCSIGGGATATAASGPTPGHFALDYDGSTVRGFVNGQLVCSVATTSAALPASLAGAFNHGLMSIWSMDDMRVSNVARYTGSFSPGARYATDANTMALYSFDDYGVTKLPALVTGTGTVIILGAFGDSSGHNNSLEQIGWGHGCFCSSATFQPYSLILGGPSPDELAGGGSPWMCNCKRGETHYPVETGTGEFWHTFDDLSIPGRGIPLDLSQTYSSHLAGQFGPLGFGWSMSYAMGLSVDGSGNVTVQAGNGAKEAFQRGGSGTYSAPSWVLATLVKNGDGTYTFTDKQKTAYLFDTTGRLIKESDRNGYATTLAYNALGLSTVTDSAGRTLTFTYSNGLIQSVSDSGGRSVGFLYDANNNLTQITDVGGGLTKFAYDANHLLLTMKDPNCSASTTCTGVTNVYDSSNRVTRQTDDMGRVTQFSYSGSTTTITEPNGSQTVDEYANGILLATTKAVGTSQQATWTYAYDSASLGKTTVTDPNGHVTRTTRDPQANVLTSTDALNRTHTYTYNSFSEVLTDQDPVGVTTTNSYDAKGNLISVSRPLTGTTQTASTSYTYGDASHPGDVTQMTDPVGKVWHYGYDQYGNRNSLTDPLADQTTYVFDVLGRMTSKVTPKGNVTGGTPSQFTWAYSYNAFGDLLTAQDPLSHLTTYTYDANRNRTQLLDANNHLTVSAYDADDELTLVTRPDLSSQATGYDSNGNMTSQTDGLQNQTKYTYDPLNHLITTVDPLSRTTTYSYDGAGNLRTVLDPQSQTTTYGYDAADELTSVAYSDGVTPGVSQITYDADGQRGTMTDGTGQTTYTVDSLHRLTQSTNGAGSQVQYGYDLKGQLTSLTYPGGVNHVTRAFDDAGRLHSVSDWLSHTTTFGYDANSNQTGVTYPNSTSATWTFDNADRLTAISDAGPSGNFLSLSYPRDPVGQVTAENSTSYAYDSINRLKTSGSQAYGYDAADNVTSTPANSLMSYDAANELTSSQAPGGQTTYGYDQRGNRTKVTPPSPGAMVNLGYDQANRLKTYGSSASYGYNGDGIRMSKTVGASTTQQTWDLASGAVPTLVQDGTTSYVTGPGGLPLEQISGTTASYYHCDQLGSTRAVTSQAGTVAGTASYDAYGVPTTSGVTTPFGFAGQYTDTESGLVYLRARYYDPSTGQFISRDPALAMTRAPYAYVGDNPLNATDPSGLCNGLDFGCYARAVGSGVSSTLNKVQATATYYSKQIETGANVLDAVSAAAGLVGAGCAGAAALATAGVVTIPADIPLAGCIAISGAIAQSSLALATVAHGAACWGSNPEGCKYFGPDLLGLGLGGFGGLAANGGRFGGLAAEAFRGLCEAGAGGIGDLARKLATGG